MHFSPSDGWMDGCMDGVSVRPTTEAARLISFSSLSESLFLMLPPQHTTPWKRDTGNHRLIKYLQEFLTNVQRAQSPQKVDPSLSSPVEVTSTLWPVQFTVQQQPQVFIWADYIHIKPPNGNWLQEEPRPPKVSDHLLGLSDVQLQFVHLAGSC